MPAFLAFDIGTSGGKACVVDGQGRFLALKKEKWSAKEPPGLEGYGSEFDAAEVESKLLSAATQVLHESRIGASEVRGIATTSLRFGYVFLDEADNPIYLGSNMDGRGFFEQDVIDEKLGDGLYEITGLYPPMLFGLAKLLWFRDNAPERFKRISKVMSLNDWWTYRLSGEFCTDHSSASTTGLYDIRKSSWSDEILSAFGLDPNVLPRIVASGTRAGSLCGPVKGSLGLGDTDVVTCGPDTQCGLLGSGCVSEEELGVVAGATTPCQLISKSPSVGSGKRVWVGTYLVPQTYVVETNAGQCGLSYDWAVRTHLGAGPDAFDKAEESVSEAGSGPTGVISLVGSQIMDLEKLHLIRPSMTIFPSPVVPPFFKSTTGAFLRAVLEEVCFAIACNIDTLEETTGIVPKSVRLTGGMTRSRTFCRILSDVTSKRVQVPPEADGTTLGAALCAMVGAGTCATFQEAIRETLTAMTTIEPDQSVSGDYAEAKRRWREVYLEMTRLTEDGKL